VTQRCISFDAVLVTAHYKLIIKRLPTGGRFTFDASPRTP